MNANVMLIRADADRYVALDRPLRLADWLDRGHDLGWPTLDDVGYHVSTLFPPVRAKGWLELRMLDALDEPWWEVAVAITAALMDGGPLAAAIDAAAAPAAGRWAEAARSALSDPVLGAAAKECFGLALEALDDHAVDADTVAAANEYAARYVARDRCPADDILDEFAAAAT
jgi:glutamate--cysteine ligase